MGAFDELESAAEDIEALLLDVLSAVLGEAAEPAPHGLEPGPLASAVVAVHDEPGDGYALVEIRIGHDLAEVLASRMMGVADPDREDVLDAVAELGNISGGILKSLLCEHARLSLPSARFVDHVPADVPPMVHVRAVVLGHVVELAAHPAAPDEVRSEGLLWPPTQLDDELERSR